jgi:[lysine-biosynthesis-protein LysW]--L-2-aminoadipate ligase
VVRPRFGKQGRESVECADAHELEAHLRRLRRRGWYRSHGALVQELMPACGTALRIVVANGTVVGATTERRAQSGESAKCAAQGAAARGIDLPASATALACAAATAIGGDLIGVDVVADRAGRLSVVEVDSAVEFTPGYALAGGDVFPLGSRRPARGRANQRLRSGRSGLTATPVQANAGVRSRSLRPEPGSCEGR